MSDLTPTMTPPKSVVVDPFAPHMSADELEAEAKKLIEQESSKYRLPPRRSIGEILADPKPLPPPVIEGLLLRGELHKVVSDSKAKKTWLAIYISFCVAYGLKIFDRWDTRQGRVLHIDAELLEGGLEERIGMVAKAMDIKPGQGRRSDGDSWLEFISTRKQPATFDDLLVGLKAEYETGELSLIVVDSQYRFYGEGEDENDNAGQARLYAKLTKIASDMDVAILMVHHSSKGNQSNKKVQDVGSGAGSQSRFADGLLVFREHELDDCVVFEGLTRHHRDPEPLTLKWELPLWVAKDGIEPEVKQPKSAHTEKNERARSQKADKIAERFKNGKPFNVTDANKVVGGNYNTVTTVISQMHTDKKLAHHSCFIRKHAKGPSDHYTTDLTVEFDENYGPDDYYTETTTA